MQAQTVNGGCFCGAVRFAVELPTLFCAHCHCSMCRRAHGAGYVTWFGLPVERLTILAGMPQLVRFQSSDHGTRSFCRGCGSALFCESTRHPDYVDIVLANMDGAIDRQPEFHVFYDDRAEWVRVGDDLPRMGGATGVERRGDE
jgi:hypothetical protein